MLRSPSAAGAPGRPVAGLFPVGEFRMLYGTPSPKPVCRRRISPTWTLFGLLSYTHAADHDVAWPEESLVMTIGLGVLVQWLDWQP